MKCEINTTNQNRRCNITHELSWVACEHVRFTEVCRFLAKLLQKQERDFTTMAIYTTKCKLLTIYIYHIVEYISNKVCQWTTLWFFLYFCSFILKKIKDHLWNNVQMYIYLVKVVTQNQLNLHWIAYINLLLIMNLQKCTGSTGRHSFCISLLTFLWRFLCRSCDNIYNFALNGVKVSHVLAKK